MNLGIEFYFLLFGQLITIIVVFVSNYLERRRAVFNLQSEVKIKNRVEHLERQLSEFYGPVYILLLINYSLVKLRFDPDVDEYTNLIPEEVWQDLRDNVLVPNNSAIVEIIKSKIHLIESPEIQDCIQQFVVHAEVWKRAIDRQMSRDEYLARFKFPSEFREIIFKTTESLKIEYYSLIGKPQTNVK